MCRNWLRPQSEKKIGSYLLKENEVFGQNYLFIAKFNSLKSHGKHGNMAQHIVSYYVKII